MLAEAGQVEAAARGIAASTEAEPSPFFLRQPAASTIEDNVLAMSREIADLREKKVK